jgi:hypothetical protein
VPAYQDPLAAEAGADNAVEASGSDGSDAGDDAGLAAIGVVTTTALGVEDDEGATSLLLQPRSAAAHRSAQRQEVRFMEIPFLWRWVDRASCRATALQA